VYSAVRNTNKRKKLAVSFGSKKALFYLTN